MTLVAVLANGSSTSRSRAPQRVKGSRLLARCSAQVARGRRDEQCCARLVEAKAPPEFQEVPERTRNLAKWSSESPAPAYATPTSRSYLATEAIG